LRSPSGASLEFQQVAIARTISRRAEGGPSSCHLCAREAVALQPAAQAHARRGVRRSAPFDRFRGFGGSVGLLPKRPTVTGEIDDAVTPSPMALLTELVLAQGR